MAPTNTQYTKDAINELDSHGFAPIHCYAKSGDNINHDNITGITGIQAIIETFSADINLKSSPETGSQTALHIACQAGNFSVVEYLIQAGSDINVKTTPTEQTPHELTPFDAMINGYNNIEGSHEPAKKLEYARICNLLDCKFAERNYYAEVYSGNLDTQEQMDAQKQAHADGQSTINELVNFYTTQTILTQASGQSPQQNTHSL